MPPPRPTEDTLPPPRQTHPTEHPSPNSRVALRVPWGELPPPRSLPAQRRAGAGRCSAGHDLQFGYPLGAPAPQKSCL